MSILAADNPQLTEQSIWMLGGFVGLVLLYFFMKPRRRKDPLSSMPSFPLGRQREVERQMSNLLVELSTMARQITAQLDTRAAKLELLLKEADDKLAELREANQTPALSTADNHAPLPLREIDPTELAALSDARPTAEYPALAAASLPSPPTANARYSDVYSLADEGRSPAEIARVLSRPAGEIELILALRKRS